MEGVGLMDRLLASLFLAAPTAPPRASYSQGLSPPPETSYSPGPPAPLAQATLGPLVFLLRAAMVLLSLLTGPLQSLRLLLGMVIMKLSPESAMMRDYLAWLDNMAVADMKATKYIIDKGPSSSSNEFPNFQNQ